MKLLASATSPYARKARVTIIECGLADAAEIVWVNPLGDDVAALQAANPIGKVPTLILDDGRVVFDSPVICAALEAHAGRPAATLDARVREALADGIMDAAFALVMERRRPEAQRSADWIARWRAAIERALAECEAAECEAAGAPPRDRFDCGDIARACALAYLDFRLGDLVWDAHAPHLRAWLKAVSARPSLVATAPG